MVPSREYFSACNDLHGCSPKKSKRSVSELNILVVDDYPIIRYGIRTLLEARPGWRVCSEAATGQAALQRVKRWKPQVVVLDLGLPDIHGLDVIPKIIAIHPQARILALTDHDPRETASQVLASGARGVVTKSDGLGEVIRGVQALARGESFHSPQVRVVIEDGTVGGTDPSDALATLTSRELQILKLLAEGKTNKQVGAALDVSVRTVEAHRASLMRKLSLHSLSDLIYFAIRKRIVRI
jgi:DNA-binding NarL/FixJ family response regulator